MADTNAEVARRRKLYGPYWEANKTPVSDAALELFCEMSQESIEGFEGADYIAVAPILSAALSTAQSNLAREVLADVSAANIVSHPATDYQQSLVDGIKGVEKRLRELFTRLGVEIES